MKYTHLFWDFNGTILSDMEAGMDSTNMMLAKRGLPVIEGLDAYREIFDFPIKNYYKSLGFDFDEEPYEVLAPEWVNIYNEKSKSASVIDGVEKTISAVASMGVVQVLFSATERKMLLRQLGELGLTESFDEIIGLDNIHAESKLHLAKRWREEHPDARILYVGDTLHDAENARVLGADCLLFTGGHQSRRRLSACPYPLIDNVDEVLGYIVN